MLSSLPAVRGSVATATPATDTAAAVGGLAGEVDVFGKPVAKRIAIRPHRVIGQRASLPGLDVCAASTGQAAEQHGSLKRYEEDF